MNVLGIETSTEVCSVGLIVGERTIHRSLREDRIHSEKLLTLVDQVLTEGGCRADTLDGVAVARGPGSFTGLRIGVSAAKGLVLAGSGALLGVPTMEAIARGARAAGVFLDGGVVVMDARQGEWYVGIFDDECREVSTAVEPQDRLASLCQGRVVMTDRVERFRGTGTDVLDLHAYVRGDIVALLGHERLRQGRREDVASFEPVYLKEFVIRSASRT